mmetsp:Transcript_14331/g.20460  ORF Transcript_14331/g.20460 Transcript_14331/m.20460 type:complete len:97 (-) Transcript_14331:1294-1584(-)
MIKKCDQSNIRKSHLISNEYILIMIIPIVLSLRRTKPLEMYILFAASITAGVDATILHFRFEEHIFCRMKVFTVSIKARPIPCPLNSSLTQNRLIK